VRVETRRARERESPKGKICKFFSVHITATKQHFNLLIFHYALSAPPSRLKKKRRKNVCYHFFHKHEKKLV
jgi:hypothetical protein